MTVAIYPSVLDMIGNTPMLELKGWETGPCRLFVKLENQNPGGSIKDRIGKSMIEAAEASGQLKAGGTIIEATAGNTGLGLALVAAQKGYRLILVIPDKMSPDKILHLKALGAEVRLTRSDVAKGHPEYYQDMAQALVREIPGAIWVDQFSNHANPMAHETTTGPEILKQMEGKLDAVVVGVGSGGTVTGLGRYFKAHAPQVSMVLADPEGSVLAETVTTGQVPSDVGSWLVEGIGEDFVPPNCDLSLVSDAISVSDREAFAAVNRLLTQNGILGGSSSGTLLAAAVKYCQQQTEAKRVVTFICDTGNKYLSKAYNPAWLLDQGLVERHHEGDLRDLISHRADRGEVVTVSPADTLATTYTRMRMFDVSQLPVLADGHIVGIIDESDLLLSVVENEQNFEAKVEHCMVSRLETISPAASTRDLVPIFRADKVAIVASQNEFYGLITKVDLINHLSRHAREAS